MFIEGKQGQGMLLGVWNNCWFLLLVLYLLRRYVMMIN